MIPESERKLPLRFKLDIILLNLMILTKIDVSHQNKACKKVQTWQMRWILFVAIAMVLRELYDNNLQPLENCMAAVQTGSST